MNYDEPVVEPVVEDDPYQQERLRQRVESLAAEYGVQMPEPHQSVSLPREPSEAPRLTGWWLGPDEWKATYNRRQQAILVPAPAPEVGSLVVLVRATTFQNPVNYWTLRAVTHVADRRRGLAEGWAMVSLRALKRPEKDAFGTWMREVAQVMIERRLSGFDSARMES